MDHLQHRMGENGLLPFRTGRVFNIGAGWFFAVRDEKERGPFEDQQDAMSRLDQFLNDFKFKKSALMN